ncbi:hypothetical protein BDY19DRAFT_977006 [Irpex rosettiformis]|uniref:Uncharacterized protein n=1 Tax=Irpex rosettiformis TaxID=378272 RepID=A0ACB8TPA9_9APHY|nr:hypothetical protein BDY19DRAFT_977006 [Irpex rosettiformis]
MFGRKPNWNPNGKHCYFTGGWIRLLKGLENVRQSPSQKFRGYSFAVDKAKETSTALKASVVPFDGKCPDVSFLCARKSRQGFFVERTEELMVMTMEETYWVQASVQGKMVFVASLLAY